MELEQYWFITCIIYNRTYIKHFGTYLLFAVVILCLCKEIEIICKNMEKMQTIFFVISWFKKTPVEWRGKFLVSTCSRTFISTLGRGRIYVIALKTVWVHQNTSFIWWWHEYPVQSNVSFVISHFISKQIQEKIEITHFQVLWCLVTSIPLIFLGKWKLFWPTPGSGDLHGHL